jgi:hypothetical protein
MLTFLPGVATSRLLLIRWGRGLVLRLTPGLIFLLLRFGLDVSDVGLPFGLL